MRGKITGAICVVLCLCAPLALCGAEAPDSGGNVSRETRAFCLAARRYLSLRQSPDSGEAYRMLLPWSRTEKWRHRVARLAAGVTKSDGGIRPESWKRALREARSWTAGLWPPREDLVEELRVGSLLEAWSYPQPAAPVHAEALFPSLRSGNRSSGDRLVRAHLEGKWNRLQESARHLPAWAQVLAGRILHERGESERAWKTMRRARRTAERECDAWAEAEACCCLARMAVERMDPSYRLWIREAEDAVLCFPFPPLRKLLDLIRGNAALREGELTEAEKQYRNGLEVECEDRPITAALWLNYGSLLDDSGRFGESRMAYVRAETGFRETGDLSGEAMVCLNRGALWHRLDLLDRAEEDYKDCVSLARRAGLRDLEALAAGNLGGVHLDRGEWEAAFGHFLESERMFRIVGQTRSAIFQMVFQGLCLLRAGKQNLAWLEYGRAAGESGRAPDPELRVALEKLHCVLLLDRGEKREALRVASGMEIFLDEQGWQAQSWEFAYYRGLALEGLHSHEEARSVFRRALEKLWTMEGTAGSPLAGSRFAGVGSDVLEGLLQNHLQEAGRDGGSLCELENLLEESRARILRTQMRGKVEEARLLREEASRRNVLLAEFFQGQEEMFLLLRLGNESHLRSLGGRSSVERDCSEFRQAWEKGGDSLRAAIRRLTDRLEDDWLRERLPEATALWVIPDGVWSSIPLEVFPLGGREPVGLRIPLSYHVSWSASAAAREESEAGYPRRFRAWIWDGREPVLPGLPFARREALRAMNLLGWVDGRIIEGASETRQECTLLHIVAHGKEDGTAPWGQTLVGIGMEGLYDPDELRLKMGRAGVVILSGCGTARGRYYPGEGNIGLARLFLASGSRAVVGSLSRIPDRTSYRFMECLYGRLSLPGVTLEEALLGARREMHDQPEYQEEQAWAGFILLGPGDFPLVPASWSRKAGAWTVIGLVLLLCAAMGGLMLELARLPVEGVEPSKGKDRRGKAGESGRMASSRRPLVAKVFVRLP